jgi:FMN phosphatase YigB (HAD superfamily)
VDGPLVTLLIADLPGAAVRLRGAGDEEAAAVLDENTVKTHVARVLGELGLRDRVQAVVMACETGLVAPAG